MEFSGAGISPHMSMPAPFLRRALSRLGLWSTALFAFACHSRLTYPPGGYPYPDHVTDKDTNFYFLPIRNKISRSDSFHDALVFMSYQDLNEPNLSMKPMKKDVFRLTYQPALGPSPLIIVFTEDSIIVKQGSVTDEYMRLYEGLQLDTLEQKFVTLLDRNYPIDDTTAHRSATRRHYLDSMGHRYPQLYDPAYYRSLLDKEFAHLKPLFSYTKKSYKTNPKDFEHFVTLLNTSGYWHLPISMPFVEASMDGWGYTLEANTALQYNTVSNGSWGAETGQFNKACQELIDLASLEKEVKIYFGGPPDTTTRKPFVVEDIQLEDIKEEPVQHKHKHKKLK